LPAPHNLEVFWLRCVGFVRLLLPLISYFFKLLISLLLFLFFLLLFKLLIFFILLIDTATHHTPQTTKNAVVRTLLKGPM
jgi:hypothetical protein